MSKNTLTAAQDRYWYGRGQYLSCSDCNRDSAPCDHPLSNDAFAAGARWGIATTSEMSPHIARFLDFLMLLGWHETETEAAEMDRQTADARNRDTTQQGTSGYQTQPPY